MNGDVVRSSIGGQPNSSYKRCILFLMMTKVEVKEGNLVLGGISLAIHWHSMRTAREQHGNSIGIAWRSIGAGYMGSTGTGI